MKKVNEYSMPLSSSLSVGRDRRARRNAGNSDGPAVRPYLVSRRIVKQCHRVVAAPTFWLAIMLCLCASTSPAQVVVQKSAYATMTSLPPFTGDPSLAASATKILSSDLNRSGWFKIVAAGAGEINIVGAANRSGGGFTIDVWIYSRGGSVSTGGATVSGGAGQMYAKRFSGASEAQLRQTVHALADDIVANVAKQKGIAQTRIAFISNRSGRKELYVMDYDGFNIRQITQDGVICGHPRWSPDRSRIVYLSYKARWPDVYVIELASGRRSCVAAFPGLNSGAAFSPSGNELAVVLSKDGNPDLYLMSASGGGAERLTATKGGESSPAWSPDGSRLAYSYDGTGLPSIWTMSSRGGEGTRVTGGGYYTEPDWSPTGNLIACVGRVGAKFQIFTFDPGSPSATFQARTSDSSDNEDPTWAPDGRHLVFARTVGYKSQLYVLDVLTGNATNLGVNLGDCVEPAWSR